MTARIARPPASSNELTGSAFLAIVLPLIVIELNSSFEASMIYAVLPQLNRAMGDLGNLSWVVTANSLAAAASCVLSARLADLFGRRLMLFVIPLICSVGSLISATATSLWGVVIGAGIQGLTSGMLPIAFALARDRLPKGKSALGVGLITGSLAIGGSFGMTLGGVIADHLGWQAIFYFSTILAWAGAMVARFGLPADKHLAGRIGSPMAMLIGGLFAPAIGFLIIGINGIRLWGAGDARTALSCLAGAGGLVAWSVHQLRISHPLVNLRMLARSKVILGLLCMSAIALSHMQSMLVLPLFFQQPLNYGGFGQTAAATGLLVLPSLLIGLVGGPLSGWLSDRKSPYIVAFAGLLIIALGWIGLGCVSDDMSLVIAFMVIGSGGFYLTYAALPSLVMEAVPPENTGEAAGTLSVARAVFAAIGAQIVGWLLSRNAIAVGDGHEVPALSAYLSTFFYFAALPAGAAAMLLLHHYRLQTKNRRQSNI